MSGEAAALTGFIYGNHSHPGCLTSDVNVRLHSCEKGNMCEMARRSNVIIIQPIIAHISEKEDWLEAGIGGGGGDLEKEVELEFPVGENVDALVDRYEISRPPLTSCD